jgi:hypothetical protein
MMAATHVAAVVKPALALGGVHLGRRMARSVPYLGAVVVLFTIGAVLRRKGLLGGLLDAGLDAVPFLGAAKNVAEVVRGRDLVPDLPPRKPAAPRRPAARQRSR